MSYHSSLIGHTLRLLKAVLSRLVCEVHSSLDIGHRIFYSYYYLSIFPFTLKCLLCLRIFDLKFDVFNGSPDTESFDFLFKFVIIIISCIIFY